jgi:BirA family biotin operon repressor/biotin-[acetyl-CoA-carboxylase] ligase
VFAALPEDLRTALDAARDRLGPFADLRYAVSIGSTNDAALALAAAGAPEGAAVTADQQTAGRGRQGRSWSSPAGAGVYVSAVIRPEGLATTPGLITLGAGVAIAEAVVAVTGLPVALKWPNDLVVGREWRKLGGILCEAHAPDRMVIGAGINVTSAAHPPDVMRRATSIESELGRFADRHALIVECLVRLRAMMTTLRQEPGGGILDRWRARAADGWQGAAVRWHDGDAEIRGIARDVDDDGALVVERAETRDGRRERVIAGEVIWERYESPSRV